MFISKNGLIPMNLQLFARGPLMAPDEGGGNGGAGDGAGSEEEKSTGDEKKFSQAELDEQIQKRLARESKKYDKYKDLNDEELNTYKQWKAEQETKKQNELSDLQKEKAAREKLEKEKGNVVAKANARLIRAAFLVGAKDIPEDRREAAYKLTDLSAITVDDDGNVDETLLKAAVDDALKAYPWLKDATTQKKDVGGGAGNGGGTLTAEEIAKNKAEERNKKQSERKFW
jgi:hypothetical protein